MQLVAYTPLPVRLGQEEVPAQLSSFEPTLYSDDTITEDAEDNDDGEYSMGESYDSDDSDESGQGLVLKIFVWLQWHYTDYLIERKIIILKTKDSYHRVDF